MLGKFLRPRPDPGRVRERILTPDEDFLDLDLAPDPGPGHPVVSITPGSPATLREFDEAATAPLHGFKGADDYHAASSSGPFLDKA